MLQETVPTSHYKLTEIEICHKLPKEFNLVLKTKVVFGWQHLDLDLDLKSIDLNCLDLKFIDFKIPCLGLFK